MEIPRWFRKKGIVVCFLIIVFALTGCFNTTQENNDDEPKIEGTIKLLTYHYVNPYSSSNDQFMNSYGKHIREKYPDLKIDVVGLNFDAEEMNTISSEEYKEKLKVKVEAEKPDFLLLRPKELKMLEDADQLYDLEEIMHSFVLEELEPNVMKMLRDYTDGRLYGITPGFMNQAIYYNKDLFEFHNVEVPEDQMT